MPDKHSRENYLDRNELSEKKGFCTSQVVEQMSWLI